MEPNTDFDSFLQQAWADHAADAAAVGQRLAAVGIDLVGTESHAAALAHLAHHVWGEHLGQWQPGLDFMQRMAAHPACGSAGAAAVQRCIASLRLCAGGDLDLAALTASDRIRVAAMAAANLAGRDTARAMSLFGQALAEADASGLPGTDPMNRALAATGNGLACTLEEKAARTAAERELMILAAQTARRYWAVAGTWLETERAEYRLAMTWLQAGDAAQARVHAQHCLEIVQAHDGPALERFFGHEALGLAQRATGNALGHQQALAAARVAFEALDEGEGEDRFFLREFFVFGRPGGQPSVPYAAPRTTGRSRVACS